MKYKITFKNKTKEIESNAPQSALNEAFFGSNETIAPGHWIGEYPNNKWINAKTRFVKPIFKLPKFKIKLKNDNGDIWNTEIVYSCFSKCWRKGERRAS